MKILTWLVLSALAALAALALPAAAAAQSTIRVDSAAAAVTAIARAHSGAVILFAPGTYRFAGRNALAGSNAPGVTVRAAQAGTVLLEFDLIEGFLVQAPRWTFENLSIRGVCASHARCEHAFHVVGKAAHFVARNNTVIDFNSHIKINGSGGAFPDHGRLEGNTLRNGSARQTGQPVTLIDLVAASGWTVRGNHIADFVKAGADQTSYGAFAKGGGSANRFEGNVIVCESALRGAPGQRVGLSLGGGGTGARFCRDGRCDSEQEGGVIAANLIASCSDEGIYLNRAAASTVLHNTLIGTAGIMLRFPESTALIDGNIIDGRIASSKGARFTAPDNLDTSRARLYTGQHPLRALYADADRFDWRWRGPVPRRDVAAAGVPELCGVVRPARPAYGAFEDAASPACVAGSANLRHSR